MRTLLLLLALPALASARFSVTAGGDDCAVTDGGDCVTSSGYSRGGYSENEGCTITMDPPAPLSVLDFEVEDFFDHLSIRGTDGPDKCEGGVSCWTGSNGPDGVTPAGAIVWTSDFFEAKKGFKICTTVPGGGPSSPAGPAADDEPCDSYFYNYGYLFGNVECGANKPPPPPAAPPPPPGFIVESGPCTTTKDGSCVRSDNYPGQYGINQECVIAPTQDLFLSATSFATEQNYDFLTIADEKYTGDLKCSCSKVNGALICNEVKPTRVEVKPHQKIVWDSDETVPATGCAPCATHARFTSPHVPTERFPSSVPHQVGALRESAAAAARSGLREHVRGVRRLGQRRHLRRRRPRIRVRGRRRGRVPIRHRLLRLRRSSDPLAPAAARAAGGAARSAVRRARRHRPRVGPLGIGWTAGGRHQRLRGPSPVSV